MEVSVVLTTYNLEKYIDNCFNQLSNQTFKDFEIVVIDDCSSDDTINIVNTWKNSFKERLRIVELKENMGMPALTRNYALENHIFLGRYVVFLDGDDCVELDFLEKLYTKAVRLNADVVICGYDRYDEVSGKVISKEMLDFADCLIMPEDRGMLPYINTAPWNKMWKSSVIESIRYSPIRVGEEVRFNYSAYMNSRRIAFVNEILIHYNVRINSVISKVNEDTVYAFFDDIKEMNDEVPEEYQEGAELLFFIHICLSMALKVAENKEIDLNKFLGHVTHTLKEKYWCRENTLFKLRELLKQGIKGGLMYIAFKSYKYGVFKYVLSVYRKLNLNIKF